MLRMTWMLRMTASIVVMYMSFGLGCMRAVVMSELACSKGGNEYGKANEQCYTFPGEVATRRRRFFAALRMTSRMFRVRWGWLADSVAVMAVGICSAIAMVVVMTVFLVNFVIDKVCKYTGDDSHNK